MTSDSYERVPNNYSADLTFLIALVSIGLFGAWVVQLDASGLMAVIQMIIAIPCLFAGAIGIILMIIFVWAMATCTLD